jgi:hypothetical protein
VGELEPLDPTEARTQAMALGMKVTKTVPYPVRCPVFPASAVSSKLRAEEAPFVPLVVDPKGFFRDDVGIAEAIALFGPPVLCNKSKESRYVGVDLAPRAANIEEVELSTKAGQLVELRVHFDPPVVVDFGAILKRMGARRRMPRSPHSLFPGSDMFDLKSPTQEGYFSIGRVDEQDPLGKTRVREVSLSRTPTHELLPETFVTEDDLVRLAALALWNPPPAPVDFYGTIGVKTSDEDGTVLFDQVVTTRNIAFAKIQRSGGRSGLLEADDLSLTIELKRPVAVVPARFGAALAKALRVGAPEVTSQGDVAKLRLGDSRGEVVLSIERGEAKKMTVSRKP